ncbi:MAG: manganese-dependent inorganic pyrophosphatase, partial [Candidatus Aenigmarchaeota archaeon]|nr:manganese-dependent inorganic pyrophosphatase [Candidatus Aenigmarchaeota archaeon]
MKGKILVTAQPNPDIDRVACIIGYSELLQKQGIDAHPGIVGNIHREALFILENFNVNYSKVSEKSISGFDEFILVDSSSRTGLSE